MLRILRISISCLLVSVLVLALLPSCSYPWNWVEAAKTNAAVEDSGLTAGSRERKEIEYGSEGSSAGSSPEGKKIKREAILYFSNGEYLKSGNPLMTSLVPYKRMITYEEGKFEEALVRELFRAPGGNAGTQLTSNLKLLGVEVDDGIAYVNFAGDGLSGGLCQETQMIDQIVYTLTEVSGIKAVQFLVDGKVTESLMGHIDVSRPISRAK